MLIAGLVGSTKKGLINKPSTLLLASDLFASVQATCRAVGVKGMALTNSIVSVCCAAAWRLRYALSTAAGAPSMSAGLQTSHIQQHVALDAVRVPLCVANHDCKGVAIAASSPLFTNGSLLSAAAA
jgi:hypothetical protein